MISLHTFSKCLFFVFAQSEDRLRKQRFNLHFIVALISEQLTSEKIKKSWSQNLGATRVADSTYYPDNKESFCLFLLPFFFSLTATRIYHCGRLVMLMRRSDTC